MNLFRSFSDRIKNRMQSLKTLPRTFTAPTSRSFRVTSPFLKPDNRYAQPAIVSEPDQLDSSDDEYDLNDTEVIQVLVQSDEQQSLHSIDKRNNPLFASMSDAVGADVPHKKDKKDRLLLIDPPLPFDSLSHVYFSHSWAQVNICQEVKVFLEVQGMSVENPSADAGDILGIISSCAVFVTCLSREYENSEQNQHELHLAAALRKPIIVIKTDIGPYTISQSFLDQSTTHTVETFDFSNCSLDSNSKLDTLEALTYALAAKLEELSTEEAVPTYSLHDAQQRLSISAVEVPEGDERLIQLRRILNPVELKDIQQENARKRHQDTRNWILDDVLQWTADFSPTSSRVYWLSGDAGSGKSVIAASVTVDPRIHVAAFFFCKFDEKKRSDPALLIRTLAYQLAHFDVEFCEHLLHFFELEPTFFNANNPLKVVFRKLVAEPFEARKNTTPVVICLDALDESAPEHSPLRAELLHLLSSSVPKLPYFVKLFVTSRPGAEFYEIFQDSQSNILELNGAINKSDLSHYAKDALLVLGPKFSNTDLEVTEVAETLCKLSGGLFVWMFYAIEYLASSPNIKVGLETLHQSGVNLDRMYQTSLTRSHGNPSQEQLRTFHCIVGTLVALKEPLGIQTLSVITQQSLQTLKSTLATISPLLCIFDSSVRFMHKSIADFLVDPTRCSGLASQFCIDYARANRFVLASCLQLMILEWDSSNLTTAELVDVLSGAASDLQTENQGALAYALSHWMDHLELEDSITNDPQVAALFRQVLVKHDQVALLSAVSKGRGKTVEIILKASIDSPSQLLKRAETTGYFKSTLLYESAKLGNYSVCESLVRLTDTDLNAKGWTVHFGDGRDIGENDWVVLSVAVVHNHLDIVKLLVENGVKIHAWHLKTASGAIKTYLVRQTLGIVENEDGWLVRSGKPSGLVGFQLGFR
ncbi:UNVERIFIED_CONTAM: hypothetical protein HDU68_002037 [Siphonaria sp. JEL0065]|nr:hypothetical protein HDU68_002037 [Siphonaria sp. JEL0065]